MKHLQNFHYLILQPDITETFKHTDPLFTLYAMLLCVPRCGTKDLGTHKPPIHLLYWTLLCSKVSKRLELSFMGRIQDISGDYRDKYFCDWSHKIVCLCRTGSASWMVQSADFTFGLVWYSKVLSYNLLSDFKFWQIWPICRYFWKIILVLLPYLCCCKISVVKRWKEF